MHPNTPVRTLATALALLACTACSQQAAPPQVDLHDLSGVWKISQPTERLVTTDGKPPPLTADAMKVYDEHVAAAARGERASWDETLRCKPPGEPRAMFSMSWPFQIAQSAERVNFIYQFNSTIRVVEMGRKLPDFAGPFFFGKSSGRWEGDTLIVDVLGIREEVLLDDTGLPHSEDLKLTERFRLLDGGKTLEARLHFDDPATFSQPWDAVLTFARQPDDAIVEDHCLDRLQLPNSYRPTL